MITMNWGKRWDEGMSELFLALLMLETKRRYLCFPVWLFKPLPLRIQGIPCPELPREWVCPKTLPLPLYRGNSNFYSC